jgi:GT2 family glycosyltransferase
VSAAAKPAAAPKEAALDLSIVVVSWNTKDLLRDCLASIYAQAPAADFEVILVDNASTDGSAEMASGEFPSVRLIRNPDNRGFVRANNQALEAARGRYVLLLNSDTVVLDDAIGRTLRYAELHPEAAVVGCKVLNPDRSLQRSCFMYPSPLNMLLQSTFAYKLFPKSRFFGREFMTWWDNSDERRVETICGCFSLVRRQAIDEVGPMDPIFYFYGDDPDWCRRFTKAGWDVRFFPGASIVHLGGQSTRLMRRAFRFQLTGSQLIFCRLHRSRPAFFAARLLSALFYLLRLPYWLARAAGGGARRPEFLETAGTYARGALYCLFDWKSLVMNRAELVSRLRESRSGRRTGGGD